MATKLDKPSLIARMRMDQDSYGRVAALARTWKTERQREQQTAGRGAFVPLVFQPGEAFRFDWSEDSAIIGGERTKLQAADSKLCYSRAFIVRAYLLQTHGRFGGPSLTVS